MKVVDHQKDRELLTELCEKLSISRNNLKKDELGYWRILGKKGYLENRNFIDTDGKYWYLHIFAKNSRIFKNIEKSLPEGGKQLLLDDEGVWGWESYPDEVLSNKIRGLMGSRRALKYTPEESEELLLRFKKK
jgi:hypothetical protein